MPRTGIVSYSQLIRFARLDSKHAQTFDSEHSHVDFRYWIFSEVAILGSSLAAPILQALTFIGEDRVAALLF